MSGEFLDTNMLVYSCDRSAGEKRDKAIALIERLLDEDSVRTSTQVLMEFFTVVTRKIPNPLTPDAAMELIEDFSAWQCFSPVPADVIKAIRISVKHRIGFWDALIVHAAKNLGASVIWSEDLQDGAVFEGVEIRNPFTAKPRT
jgi:predicted nucleic acid-binding protein